MAYWGSRGERTANIAALFHTNSYLKAQGIGGGGLLCLPSIIVSDMTTLRERPKFISSLSIPYAIGNFGIIIGAAVGERATWRWSVHKTIIHLNRGLNTVQDILHQHSAVFDRNRRSTALPPSFTGEKVIQREFLSC